MVNTGRVKFSVLEPVSRKAPQTEFKWSAVDWGWRQHADIEATVLNSDEKFVEDGLIGVSDECADEDSETFANLAHIVGLHQEICVREVKDVLVEWIVGD